MVHIATGLSRLNKVTQTGHNKWKACCPAHADSTPSLQIVISERGNILLKCFSGCDNHDVVSALGLRWRDLFADDSPHKRREAALRYSREQREDDEFFLYVVNSDLKKGKRLADSDIAAAKQAKLRLSQPERYYA